MTDALTKNAVILKYFIPDQGHSYKTLNNGFGFGRF